MVSLILWAKWCDRGHYLTWRHGCFGEVIYAQCCSPPLTEIRASSSWRGTARFPSQENALGKCSQALTKSGKGTPPCSLMLASLLTQCSFPHQETEKESADILQPALFLFWSWLYIHSRVLGFACAGQSGPGPYSPSPTYPTATEFSNQNLVSWRANQYHFLVHPK